MIANTGVEITHPKLDDKGLAMSVDILPNAIAQLQHIRAREANPDLMLRILVESGGCHGFSYNLSLIDPKSDPIDPEEDSIMSKDGVSVVVDEVSLGLISGSKVEYEQELIGSEFKVKDIPGAASECGCGVSFNLDFSKAAKA
ncbi:hypothetical protein YB2330_005345 [Saitoella coloradoensis]